MPVSKGPLNWTTQIPVHQTVAECQSVLAKAGASSVSVDFEDGQPSGLAFSLKTPHGPRNFALPVNIDGVQRVLAKANKDGLLRSDGHRNARLEGREHATCVAWRVVKDWLEANLALIAAQMATIDEVMLPYLVLQIGGEQKPLWRHYRDQEASALLPGGFP